MSSDNEETCTSPEIGEKAKATASNLLPEKSRERYEVMYQKFMRWRLKKQINSFSENVMLRYFDELSMKMKPSSLWAIYSMLRATINIRHNTNIANYGKLLALLKRKSYGFISEKSKTLTREEINQFLKNAPDSKHLLSKVILIFGVNGALKKQELRNIKIEDVEDTGKSLIIKIPDSKMKSHRYFVVPEEFYATCKKYMSLRPSEADTKYLPFFLNYHDEKCIKQSVGLKKFGAVPSKIAEFLGLANPKQYTGHCLRRLSTTILVDAGGDLLALKRHGGWHSSTVAEGYVDNSTKYKNENAVKISNAVCDSDRMIPRLEMLIWLLDYTSEIDEESEKSYNSNESGSPSTSSSKRQKIFANTDSNVGSLATETLDIPHVETETIKNDSSPRKSKSGTKRKLRKSDPLASDLDESSQILQLIAHEPSRNEAKQQKDECQLYTDLLCSRLRAFDADTRVIAMHKIDNIMFRLRRSANYVYSEPTELQPLLHLKVSPVSFSSELSPTPTSNPSPTHSDAS